MAAARIRTAPAGETIQKGTATLVAGVVDVLARVPALSIILATVNTQIANEGNLSTPTANRTATQFRILSQDSANVSIVDWAVFPPTFDASPSGRFQSTINNLGVEIFTGVETLNGTTPVTVDLGALDFLGALEATSIIIATYVTFPGAIGANDNIAVTGADRDVGAQTFDLVGTSAGVGASTCNWMIINDAKTAPSGKQLPAGQITLVAGTGEVAEDFATAGPGGLFVINNTNPASATPTRGEITSLTAATIATNDAGDTPAIDFIAIQ